jgi:hypothetical protein
VHTRYATVLSRERGGRLFTATVMPRPSSSLVILMMTVMIIMIIMHDQEHDHHA